METDQLTELVENDPDRSSMEKESAFTMLGNEKQLTAMSAKRTIVASLLEHNEFEPDWFIVESDGETKRVESVEAASKSDAIYAVSGKMPVGCLTVKSKPRSKNHQSSIVNSETISEDAFN